MAAKSRTTTDHHEIRRWVEEHGGRPASVRDTETANAVGMLRIDFPGGTEGVDSSTSPGTSGFRSSRKAGSRSSTSRKGVGREQHVRQARLALIGPAGVPPRPPSPGGPHAATRSTVVRRSVASPLPAMVSSRHPALPDRQSPEQPTASLAQPDHAVSEQSSHFACPDHHLGQREFATRDGSHAWPEHPLGRLQHD